MKKLKQIGFGLLGVFVVSGVAIAYAELRPMTVERAQIMYQNATAADDKVRDALVLTGAVKHGALCVLTRAKVNAGETLKDESNLLTCGLIKSKK